MINVGGSYAFLPEQKATIDSLNAGDHRTVSLKADNGQFLRAAAGGGSFVYADRTETGPDEKFVIYDLDGPVLSDGHNVTLGARRSVPPGRGRRKSNGAHAGHREGEGPWETFIIEREDGQDGFIPSGSKVRLHSIAESPYFVSAEFGGGGIVNDTQNRGPWESFTLTIR